MVIYMKILRLFGTMATRSSLRMIDIGANLTDPVFRGQYHGKQAHPSDLEDVLTRARDTGVEKIIITGGSLKDSKSALALAKTNEQLYCTVGCHPTRCGDFEKTAGCTPDEYLEQLLALAEDNRDKVVAIGECGLDYDRLFFCDKPLQLKYFEKQFYLSERTGLPLFLHCRNAFENFIDIMVRNKGRMSGGVVHSFTGTLPEAMSFIEHGLYIGINGCSLKTPENLDVVKSLPVEKLMIETDAPWCEIRPSHASSKLVETHFPSRKKEKWEKGMAIKSRNEPRNIVNVLEVISNLHKVDKYSLAEQLYKNTCTLFKWSV